MIENNNIPLPSVLAAETAPPVENVNSNPLAQYFRHSKLQIALPSGGKFWPDGTLMLNDAKLLDVFPMTARDEIMMKSPDGLLSGTSIADTITSCIPGIKNAWMMPAHDVDTILVAIRLASYEQGLEITTNCTHCDAANKDEIDLTVLLDSITKDSIQNVYTEGDLTFEFAPYTFEFINKNNKAKFDQEQLARSVITEATPTDEKSKYFATIFNQLATHNVESLVIAINKIVLQNGAVVTDKAQLTEFINAADRKTIQDIRNNLVKMNDAASIPDITLTCSECDETYKTTVEFNQSNFFE